MLAPNQKFLATPLEKDELIFSGNDIKLILCSATLINQVMCVYLTYCSACLGIAAELEFKFKEGKIKRQY